MDEVDAGDGRISRLLEARKAMHRAQRSGSILDMSEEELENELDLLAYLEFAGDTGHLDETSRRPQSRQSLVNTDGTVGGGGPIPIKAGLRVNGAMGVGTPQHITRPM